MPDVGHHISQASSIIQDRPLVIVSIQIMDRGLLECALRADAEDFSLSDLINPVC
jgi:hypothetical protein